MAIGDLFNAFADTTLGLMQQRIENQRQERAMRLQELGFQQETEKLKLFAEMKRDQMQHERELMPLEIEAKKYELEQVKKSGADENFARAFGLADLRQKAALKLRFAEQSQDPILQSQVPYLKEQMGLLDQQHGRMSMEQMAARGEQGPPQAPPAYGSAPQATAPGGGMVPRTGAAQPAAGATPSGPLSPETPEWYRDIASQKPGSTYRTPSGQEFFITQTPEESKQKQAQLEQMGEMFPGYQPPRPISKAEAEEKAKAIEMQRGEQQIAEFEQRERIDLAATIGNRAAVQLAFGGKNSPTRMVVTPEGGVAFQNVDLRSISRDRAALEELDQQQKLTPPMLRAYDQALAQAFAQAASEKDAEGNPTELARSLVDAGPGQFRVNRLQMSDRSQSVINNLKGAQEFMRAQGHEPALNIREPNPAELVQDFQALLPEELKRRRIPIPLTEGIGIPSNATIRGGLAGVAGRSGVGALFGGEAMAPPAQRGAAKAVAPIASKFMAQLARAISAAEDDPRLAQDLQQAKQHFLSLQNDYDLRGMSGADPAIPVDLPKAVNTIMDAGLKRASKAPAQKAVGQAGGGFGAGPLGTAAMMGTMASMGAQENVTSANSALGSVAKAKDREAAAKAAVSKVRTEWQSMTEKERKTFKGTWAQAKNKWKSLGVPLRVINELEDFLNPKK